MKKYVPKIVDLIFGPFAFIPILLLVCKIFNVGGYSPEEIGHLQKIPLLLQGSDDMGGSNIYAIYVVAYITFGFLGTIYLNLKIWQGEKCSFKGLFWNGVRHIKYYLAFFFITAPFNFDADGKGIFFLFAIIYFFTFFLIIIFNHFNVKKLISLLLSPLFIYLFLIVASDGTSQKAGQILSCGQERAEIVRSVRHGLMLKWHSLCHFFFDFKAIDYFFVLLAYVIFLALFFFALFSVFNRFGNILQKRTNLAKRQYWQRIVGVLCLLLFLHFSYKYFSFRTVKSQAIDILNTVFEKTTMETIKLIKKDPALEIIETNFIKKNMLSLKTLTEIDKLVSKEIVKDYTFRILIPLKEPYYFYLDQNAHFRYADTRKLKNEHSYIINYPIIKKILEQKKDYISSFLTMREWFPFSLYADELVIGKVILGENQSIEAVLLIDKKRW